MASTSSYGFAQYQASESHQFWAHRFYKPNATERCLIWCHGAGGDYATGPHEKLFASAGIPIIACDLGGANTWGSDTALTRIQTAWTFAQTKGVATDKYGIWGASMGSLLGLLAVLADPTHVSVMGAALPVVDPEQVRAANAGGYKADIETVYGVGTVPTAKRPNQNNSSFVSAAVPIKLWISSDDTVGDAALANSFVSAIGAESASLGAVGHSYLSLTTQDAIDFLLAHLNA